MIKSAYGAGKWYMGVGNSFDRNYLTPAASRAMKGVGSGVKAMPSGFNNLALSAGLSVFLAEQTYDPMVHDSKMTEIGKQAIGMGIDNIPFMINPVLGFGMLAASMAGVPTLGSMAVNIMDEMGKKTSNARYGKGVTQNERTMRATRSNLAMLQGAGNHTQLGNEAMLMHT